jgi:ribosome-associated toxin RatA of RatAB toxin-antitoxin module
MTVKESVVIDAPPAALFRLTQDYARRLEWDPFLKSASLVGGATEAGVGVRALCVSRSGWGMETEYVSFNPPCTTAVKMTSGPWFLRSFAGSWRFEEMPPNRTQVHFIYRLAARPGWLAWLLTPLLTRVFGRDTRKRLQALKAAVGRGVLDGRGKSDVCEPTRTAAP